MHQRCISWVEVPLSPCLHACCYTSSTQKTPLTEPHQRKELYLPLCHVPFRVVTEWSHYLVFISSSHTQQFLPTYSSIADSSIHPCGEFTACRWGSLAALEWVQHPLQPPKRGNDLLMILDSPSYATCRRISVGSRYLRTPCRRDLRCRRLLPKRHHSIPKGTIGIASTHGAESLQECQTIPPLRESKGPQGGRLDQSPRDIPDQSPEC